MKTLKEAAHGIGVGPETLRRKILAGVVPSTRHPQRGYLLDNEAIATASAIFAAVKALPAKRKRAIEPVPQPSTKQTPHAAPHPHDETYKAQIKGLEALVDAKQAQVHDLQTRLTAAEYTIRACALMAPAASMLR